ncbi:MAG: hypothetical protein JSU70_04430 [Phycisphaerales bacterium]|nr:MAG: hypothetical protein JSU70_04430 [Phycisphaerales bacterium]
MDTDGVELAATPTNRVDPHSEDVNLFDYVRVFLKYRKMIFLICVVAVGATTVFTLLSLEKYSATTSIVPPLEFLRQQSELTGGLGLGNSSLLGNALGVTSIADMYVGILESRAVADAIIDKFDLMDVYKKVKHRSDARRKLKKSTRIGISDEGIVTVTVRDSDPNRAAAIANTYVEELDGRNKTLSSGQATSKREFLGNRLAEIEQKLAKIDNILSREAKVQEMLFELLTTEYEIAKIEEAKSMPTIQVLDKAIVPERPVARGTTKKAAIACVASLMLGTFAAFAREYIARSRSDTGGQQQRTPKPAQEEDVGYAAFEDLEGKRKIVTTQRRRRPQQERLGSHEA